MSTTQLDLVKKTLLQLQADLTDQLRRDDPAVNYKEDPWRHPEGGGGNTRVFADGLVFEKAAVNFSHVFGNQLPASASLIRPDLVSEPFDATGLSVIIHPVNPFVPTVHMNLRFFASNQLWWFGGGYDLTPYYGFDEDCRHWHRTARAACEPFGEELYPRFKQWADDYFYIRHRQEARGIGGIFFDDLNWGDFARNLAFIQQIGQSFVSAYFPIVAQRKTQAFTPEQRDFQCYRRGRYVEFNLVYDRGTLFGLQSDGRIESILVSLPPKVIWRYDWQPEPGSLEAQLYQRYLVPRDWANEAARHEK